MFSLTGLAGRAHRYAELSSHFRLQYLIIASVCLIALAVFRNWRWVMASAFCLLLNAALVVPWYLSPTESTAQPQAHNFRVLLANVLYSNRNYRALLDLVKAENPDLIVLQEATPKWVAATQELKPAYPYFLLGDDATIGGVACYSRCEMEEARLSPELRHSVAGPVIKLNFRGRAVSIIAIHPPPPVTRHEFAVRNAMLVAAAEAARQLPPTVLIGDLNSTMWSPYFSQLLRDSGLKNARRGFGVLPTWPMFLPPMKIPIDHCLVSDEVFVVNCRTGSFIGSDHLPLIVDLALPNEN